MGILEFLANAGVDYEVSEHAPVFSAQKMAAVEHEPGIYVAKPVIIKADEQYVMCVVSANRKVDLTKMRMHLGAQIADLAGEAEIAQLFPDCELGAEPPFGVLYDMPTFMDQALEKDDHILFQAGNHGQSVRMSMADYCRLAAPRILDFSFDVPF
jgi:Ala-tRNA(Pro) deacylase